MPWRDVVLGRIFGIIMRGSRQFILLQISFLLLLLIGVVFTMKKITPENMQTFFATMGADTSSVGGGSTVKAAHVAPAPAVSEAYNLCKTRISSFRWFNDFRIEESKDSFKGKWMAYDPAPSELNYLEMEKWLSQHCEVPVQKSAEQVPASDFHPFVTIRYIDGSSFLIETAGPGRFRMDGQIYRSDELMSAFRELMRVGGFRSPPLPG
jgi:hypothetical protein